MTAAGATRPQSAVDPNAAASPSGPLHEHLGAVRLPQTARAVFKRSGFDAP